MPNKNRGHVMRGHLLGFVISASAALLIIPAFAQGEFPKRHISYILPFGPGAHSHAVALVIAKDLEKDLGRPVVVENKAGAGGSIAAQFVAQAPPDGHTLFQTTTGIHVANPIIYKSLNYNPVQDFAPVAMLVDAPLILIVRHDSPIRTVADLIEHGRKTPGKLNYASPGVGTAHHIAGALFNVMTGVGAVHVPFSGSAPSIQALMAGDIQFIFEASALPLLESGRARALAVTSAERWYSVPNIPTMIELGFADFQVVSWYGIMAPRATPPATVGRLNAALNKALSNPAVRSHIEKHLGMRTLVGTVAEFSERIERDTVIWHKNIRAANIALK
jgi:tripartite-type tricarboxylate transporter receptor subunit TctC